jgi:DNA-binding LacI/PurR family transcriptional regulator
MAQFTVPPLTSVRMAGTDLAAAACNALPLTHGPNSHTAPRVQLMVPTKLTVRQTSGYVRKGNLRSVASRKKSKVR